MRGRPIHYTQRDLENAASIAVELIKSGVGSSLAIKQGCSKARVPQSGHMYPLIRSTKIFEEFRKDFLNKRNYASLYKKTDNRGS